MIARRCKLEPPAQEAVRLVVGRFEVVPLIEVALSSAAERSSEGAA